MVSLEEAVGILQEATNPIPETEVLPLREAIGYTLAEDATAQLDQPPFPRSPLDGYAVRAADVAGASRSDPVRLRVCGSVWTGKVYTSTVEPGTAVRILTGAPVPNGADTVIRQEDTDRGMENVSIFSASRPYENYCFAGEDWRAGDVLIKRGMVLRGAGIALLAGLGRSSVTVYRKPRVTIILTGDEIVMPGQQLAPGKIYDTNGFYLETRLMEMGIPPEARIHAGDELAEILLELDRFGSSQDLVLTTGGVSVGERDRIPAALSAAGAQPLFQGVCIKPGAPVMAAKLGSTILLCLSGNPYAAVATFELLARPVLARMTGNPALEMVRQRAVLESDFPKRAGVRRFLRGFANAGKVRISAGNQASGALSALVDSNCLVEIPTELAGAEKGREVWIYLL